MSTFLSNPVVKGSSDAILQHNEWSFDPRSGWEWRQVYEGSNQAVLDALVNYYTRRRLAVRVSGVAPKLSLEVSWRIGLYTANGVEIPQDSWEMPVNEVYFDIFRSPNALRIEASRTGSLNAIHADFERQQTVDQAGNPLPSITFTYAGDGVTLAPQLFRLLIRKTDSYPMPQYVLRHRMRVSENFTFSLRDANVNRIYTTPQLLAECSKFAYPLPTPLRAKIAAIPVMIDAGDVDLLWGWRTLPSNEATVGGGSIDISTVHGMVSGRVG